MNVGHLSTAGDPNAMLKVAQLHARAFCSFRFFDIHVARWR